MTYMSSVSFKKLHSKAEVVSIVRHCDKDERKKHKHSNEDIKIEHTDSNLQNVDFTTAIRRYEERIRELDSKTNSNKRKDRVTCFSLEIPAPENLSSENLEQWYIMVTDFLKRKYKGQNVISHYLHRDEVHEYYDHGQLKKSRAHIHAFVIPEVDGKLNGKLVSSKENMRRINREIHSMTRSTFGIDFMTGEDPRHRTVEDLKRISEKEIQKVESKIKSYAREIVKAQEELERTELKANRLKEAMKSIEESGYQKLYIKSHMDDYMRFKAMLDDEIEREIKRKKNRTRNVSR